MDGPNKGKVYYVRTAGVVGDVRLYDACNLFVATDNVANGLLCGEIHLEYDLFLINPQGGEACGGDTYAAAEITNSNLPTYTSPFDGAGTSNGAFVEFPNNSNFTLKTPGNYVVSVNAQPSASVTTSSYFSAAVVTGTCSVSSVQWGINSVSNECTQIFLIDQTSVEGTYNFTWQNPAGTLDSVWYITPAPG
jgi:hypothetical protein